MVLIPYIHPACPPKGISTNSEPFLRIFKNSKNRYDFRHEVKPKNNVKYMFLISDQVKVIHYRFLT